MKKLTDKQKKVIFYIGIAIIFIIIIVVFLISNTLSKTNTTEKDRITNYLQRKAISFYEGDYYETISSLNDDTATFLNNFKEEGISMSIQVLLDNNVLSEADVKENLINKDNNKKCDYDNTKVVIYPQKPYKKESHKVRIQLDCGIKENEKNK